MGIRDLIKKKDQLDGGRDGVDRETLDRLAGPEFTFVRSDTQTHEIIRPPSYPTEYGQSNNYSNNNDNNYLAAKDAGSSASKTRRSLDVFRPRSRGSSTSSVQSDGSSRKDKEGGHHGHRRLSQRLHLSKAPSTSDYVPENLPQINLLAAEDGGSGVAAGKGGVDKDLYENQWEKRATILAEANVRGQRRIASPSSPSADIPSLALHDYDGGNGNGGGAPHGRIDGGGVSSKAVDDMIQEAIRLHESGQLDQSTQLFGRLADPHGANNPLSQVLYGLALRSVNPFYSSPVDRHHHHHRPFALTCFMAIFGSCTWRVSLCHTATSRSSGDRDPPWPVSFQAQSTVA